ncbi:ParB N-terminal domain-containing protein [Rhizobium lentis]|uniref:ParB N-terminal domain-containing protein n=1 Tax=Rhizobium lentis TaxID=1138194 RepID=UPI001C83FA70|nr:ParB N-terminal domain-containing protein [Rhizobium lentis]MBX5001847.1 ParB N-terminal domain-containing protein [Rhizobium lentis]
MLQWLDIADLVIDDRYQRELKAGNWKAIRKIAERFQWSRFSPVFVAPVEGGKYAIIDGQHRTHAAALCGIEKVPCQVVHMTLEEQAESFAAVNGTVTKVTVWQIFRAASAAKEPWALRLHEIASAAGCRVMESNASAKGKKPGEIYGVNRFRSLCDQFEGDTVTSALSLLMSCEGWNETPELWDTGTMIPVAAALCKRPSAMRQASFKDEFELWPVFDVIDDVQDTVKKRIRLALPYAPKHEQLGERLVAWIDEHFPGSAVARAISAQTSEPALA